MFGWSYWTFEIHVHLGKQVEAAKVTDNAVDLWEALPFSARLKKNMTDTVYLHY